MRGGSWPQGRGHELQAWLECRARSHGGRRRRLTRNFQLCSCLLLWLGAACSTAPSAGLADRRGQRGGLALSVRQLAPLQRPAQHALQHAQQQAHQQNMRQHHLRQQRAPLLLAKVAGWPRAGAVRRQGAHSAHSARSGAAHRPEHRAVHQPAGRARGGASPAPRGRRGAGQRAARAAAGGPRGSPCCAKRQGIRGGSCLGCHLLLSAPGCRCSVDGDERSSAAILGRQDLRLRGAQVAGERNFSCCCLLNRFDKQPPAIRY